MYVIDKFTNCVKGVVTEFFTTETTPPSKTSTMTMKQQPINKQYQRLEAYALGTTPKTESACKEEYDACIEKGGLLKNCYPKYKICSASALSEEEILEPDTFPTLDKLETIQGKTMDVKPPVLSLNDLYSKYKVLESEDEEEPKPKTKKGKKKPKAGLSPSLRDQIRDDIAIAIRHELDVSK